jgi:hypothetical protein
MRIIEVDRHQKKPFSTKDSKALKALACQLCCLTLRVLLGPNM